jgi:hypothetical protein
VTVLSGSLTCVSCNAVDASEVSAATSISLLALSIILFTSSIVALYSASTTFLASSLLCDFKTRF